ncbi:phage tail protein [Fulvivirga maritima]|uniref:phage tail protein n=1 Tax=Fulvivirga maritima TaxID=2904247 RepID=UPI001F1EA5D4|nr:phage tail protein [Fulvivirga maritima]UII27385.1 phage tail protein [Fulvivirga maritima]
MAKKKTNVGQWGKPPYYPLVGFYFSVSFEGITNQVDSKFSEVSGITMEITDGITVKEGGENGAVYELPGRAKYSDLVLKRGLLKANTDLSKWCMSFFSNDYSSPMVKKNIYVKLLNQTGKPVFTWLFSGAHPKKMEIGGFNSTATGDAAIVVETITLVFEDFKIIN